MAINRTSVREGAIILVDEIENSLEPYRLRHLIRELRPKADELHQVVFTTHSSVTVLECQAQELHAVRSNVGLTTICPIDPDLQPIVRSIPEAFLSKSVIVCEGKTEAGLCRGLDLYYWQPNGQVPLAAAGVAPVESPKGGGSEAPKYAIALAKLGYRVAYLGDSDTDLNPSKDDMQKEGCEVLLWDDGIEVERRLCRDLPVEGLKEFVDLAIELEEQERHSKEQVGEAICEDIHKKTGMRPRFASGVEALLGQAEESLLREAIGCAADQEKWFKRMDKGQRLGELVAKHLDRMEGTATARTVKALQEWCYAP
jgi:hypothetical protein